VTYAAKIEKAEARIDWNKPARAVLRHVHGLSPFPGAWCEMGIEGEQVRAKILRCAMADGSGVPGDVLDDHLTVACKEGALRILELQRAGKAPMKAEDFLRGTPLKAGRTFRVIVIPREGGVSSTPQPCDRTATPREYWIIRLRG